MARGWESKEVESQIETAAAERDRKRSQRLVTAEEASREREREHLETSRARVVHDLSNPNLHPRHRQMLESALTDLDGKLAALTGPISGCNPDANTDQVRTSP